jgi:pyridoxine 4-dehydrogenase
MAEVSAAAAGTITLGDLTVNRLGLGSNRMTDTPAAHTLLKRAVDLDVNFIDTAYRYTAGNSETTIGKTLAPYDGVVIATKGGWEDALPDALREELEESLRRLRTDRIDLYQLHRVNPNIPIEESVGMLKRFQDEGKVRHIGLSEVTIEQLERAQQVATIVSVQNQYNVTVRDHEDLVDYCTEQGIAFIPWFPLGGLAGGAARVEAMLADVAATYSATPQQIALAWLLKRSPMILPIPGTLSVAHLEENIASVAIELSAEDYRRLTELR